MSRERSSSLLIETFGVIPAITIWLEKAMRVTLTVAVCLLIILVGMLAVANFRDSDPQPTDTSNYTATAPP